MLVFSFSLSARLRRSLPQRTLSRASSSSASVIAFEAAARREQRGFVDHIGQFRAGITGRAARDDGEIDAFGQLHVLGMNPQNFLAASHVGQIDRDLAIETARTQQRRIEHVGPVGRRDDDDAFLRVEAVHLDEQRIERLFAFVVAAADAVSAMPADGVDFVDENQAGRGFLALLEHVAHAARADADEHFDEIRAADGEERHVRFAGDGPGEQRLAGARRADHQHALGNAPAEFLKLLRVPQELDQFLHFVLRFLDARRRP